MVGFLRRHHDGMKSLPKDIYLMLLKECSCGSPFCMGEIPAQITKYEGYTAYLDFSFVITQQEHCIDIQLPSTRVIYQIRLQKYDNKTPYRLYLAFNDIFVAPLHSNSSYEYDVSVAHSEHIPAGGGYIDKYVQKDFQSKPFVMCKNGTPLKITLTTARNYNIQHNAQCHGRMCMYYLQ